MQQPARDRQNFQKDMHAYELWQGISDWQAIQKKNIGKMRRWLGIIQSQNFAQIKVHEEKLKCFLTFTLGCYET